MTQERARLLEKERTYTYAGGTRGWGGKWMAHPARRGGMKLPTCDSGHYELQMGSSSVSDDDDGTIVLAAPHSHSLDVA